MNTSREKELSTREVEERAWKSNPAFRILPIHITLEQEGSGQLKKAEQLVHPWDLMKSILLLLLLILLLLLFWDF